MKEKTLPELEDDIKSLNRKRMKIIVEAGELDKEIGEVSEKFYALNPDYVKVTCPNCLGQGYLKPEDSDKPIKCQVCNLKCYLWMNVWKGDKP